MRSCIVCMIVAACGSTDSDIESARKRILALDQARAAQIVAFCSSWHQDGALPVDQFPKVLPATPVTASANAGIVTFSWWNNNHREENDKHPGFELICASQQPVDAKSIAPGLWYRDTPMND